ncbi:C2 domain-containing protein 3 [Nylanderia fulva]|uniref:C2 domain-containing protein 3 n=1 Tax=Nylanderia fulva TaxID=613905 RepID=UPI0010FB21F1|nr:C2 domain-containing protein 3 [Nylanderia fulva]XP_029177091.1 C2 domain-containing protein 3 [Nylanderia fulva]
MDSEAKSHKSLPPFVEGKTHGSLRLVIDEVLWLRSPGDVTVVASWWGEHDSAQFRPISSTTDTVRTEEDTNEIYTVKTNATLFEDYLKNCGTIELVIIVEKTDEIIGTARIGDLSKIFTCKYYTQFVPILNNNGDKIGKLRVSLQLTYLTKLPNMQLKTCKYSKKQEKSDVLASVDDLKHDEEIPVTSYKNANVIKKRNFAKSTNNDECDTYRSVLNTKRLEFQESKKKFNEIVTDKLVAQIVARAQRLRGAILKEAYNDDSLALSDNSMSNGLYPYASVENEAKLYEYLLGTEMTSSEEKKALNTLRSTSPTPSLIDLASEMITTSKKDNISRNENSLVKSNSSVEDVLYEDTPDKEMKGAHPLDYVDSIRILIESFTLSPAGYRRVKSMRLLHVPLSPTYFIQYDTTFALAGQTNIKSNKEIKLVKTCSKKQFGQVIDFNSEAKYIIPRHIVKKNFPLKFKMFVRHLNQKFQTELGFGSMNINDITKIANLSSTQNIAVINKGIKMGDLRVTAELGYNFTFGKEFIDAIVSTKENIPVLEMKSLSSNSNKYRSVTGTQSSKSSSKVSSVSAKRIGCLTSNNKDLIAMRDIAEHRERSSDNKKIDTSNPESGTKDKVLLHGLIYVAEGKNLPESNTYLICRAFWREDKATSQICSNTKNPFYHFFQLVPLIHGIELLERIRDNYIIIEVYSRQNGETDNLLGIAKLPVHQLYIAYRDPLVLPHLLLSKYPVISVDGWVSINNPVSGEFCGELLALVALGTAEQIALLEVSRGLRSASVIPRTVYHCHVLDNTNNATSAYQENLPCNVPEALDLNSRKVTRDNHLAYHIYSTSDRDSASADYKSQESQTDISTLRDAERPEKLVQEVESEQLALHALVDRLTNVLHTNKINTDQSAQTEMNQADEGETNQKELHLNTLNSNSLTDNSDNSCGLRNDFQLPTEMYRSVGVGAEYDEELDRQQNNAYDNLSNLPAMKENAEDLNAECDSSFFRSVMEIECALHLPKMKGPDDFVEPSTYVTFQDLIHKLDSNSHLNSCVMTNVFPRSCNPKWNWKCDAKLPMDLLLNNQKRLILKVWYLIDPDTSMEINLGKDIVIGFSAVDLSVLMAGFPTVSGWFHIMDFTGKCNGQIKISVTPLDSLPLGKFSPTGSINLSRCNNLSQSNWLHLCNTPCSDTAESNNAHQMLSYASYNKDRYAQSTEHKSNEAAEISSHGLEDVSMSFLSSSLKQKLTELDEITKRLQSRLSDVTNTAFEDDFDNDFDMIEPNSDNENTDDKNVEVTSQSTVYPTNDASQIPKQNNIQSDQNVNDVGQSFAISSSYNSRFEPGSDQVRATSSNATDTGCADSNARSIQHLGYYHNQYQNRYGSSIRNLASQSNSTEYPARGTKTPINHLLDKLSLDLPPRPPTASAIPMRRDILELFASLREHRNNYSQDKDKNDRTCVETCSVPTQTDDSSLELSAYSHVTNLVDDVGCSKSSQTLKSQSCNRISTVIREELVTEENNESSNCDELTTYLIASNVRHMDLDCIFNPLLYQHLLPDLQVAAVSPEGEAEQLDNQYARSFGTAMMMRDSRIDQNLTENKTTLSRNDVPTKNRTSVDSEENVGEFSILTDSDISENADSNIDVTVIYKSSNNDLMSDNSTESTIDVTSFNKSTQQTDIGNYCTSTVSELSVSGVSRQAPEGGNPVEETKIVSVISSQQDDIQDVSGDS